jgi:hypothetical protein
MVAFERLCITPFVYEKDVAIERRSKQIRTISLSQGL